MALVLPPPSLCGGFHSRLAEGCLQPSDIHVLLVDDEALSRVVVGNLLRKCNYKVTVVDSGPQALEILRRSVPGTFQLILTDVMMPDVDGLDLLRYVRSNNDLSGLPVIMMSANERRDAVFEAIKYGAEEYLVKPVTRKEVQNIWQYVWKRLAAAQPPRKVEATDSAMTGWVGGGGAARSGAGGGASADGGSAAAVGEAAGALQRLAPEGALPATAVAAVAAAEALEGGALAGCAQPAATAPPAAAAAAEQLHPATQPAAAAPSLGAARPPAAAGVRQGGGGAAAAATAVRPATVSLARWLLRPGRTVDPREALWVFCEVLLLLERAAGAAGGACDAPVGIVRPSRLRLASDGRVSLGPVAAPAPGAEAGGLDASAEERLYRSPEEAAASLGDPSAGAAAGGGRCDAAAAPAAAAAAAQAGGRSGACPLPPALSLQSDVYSLGVLFFDLFFSPAEAAAASAGTSAADGAAAAAAGGAAAVAAAARARARALQDLRQRILPASFLRQRPQEAVFVLSLLQPDPRARPTLGELLTGELLGSHVAALRQRRAAQTQHAGGGRAALADADALLFFLGKLQQRKRREVARVRGAIAALDGSIAVTSVALAGAQRGLSEATRIQQQHGLPAAAQTAAAARQGSAASVCASDASGSGAGGAGAGEHGGGDSPATAAVAPACEQRQQQQQQQQQQQRQREQGDSDDEEMEARERGGRPHKRARVAPRPPPPSLPSPTPLPSPAAGAGDASGEGVPAAVASRWTKVLAAFPALEAAFFRRKEQWEAVAAAGGADAAHQQQQQQQGQPPPPLQDGAPCSGDAALALRPAAPPPGPAAAVAAAAAAAAPAAHAAAAAAAPAPSQQPLALQGYLGGFCEDLGAWSRYSRFTVRASMHPPDLLGGGHMVCSAAFDRDEEFFATAGVSKRVRVFEYARVLAGGVGADYPVLELSSRSRLSGVAWSAYVKAHLASCDYDGVVTLWDANTASDVLAYEEHAKRVWSIDFCGADPTRLASGSDDGTVRLWSIHQESSVATIDTRANVCCVQWAPESPHLLAVASANYRLYLYDLRSLAAPLAAVGGHARAVSYVRFLSPRRMVTASTDSTLRVWDVERVAAGGAAADACEGVLVGHANEKNFVGLAAGPGGYIAVGSETNQVHAYHRALPMPFAAHHMSDDLPAACGGGGGSAAAAAAAAALDADAGDQFVSCVTWSARHGTLLTANSAGSVQLLQLE